MQSTKSLAPKEIRDALASTRDFQAVTGKISIDPKRNASKPAVVLEIKDGKFLYKTTVNP
jgi:branched-chain amino acid transport system substrate-binding protein